MSVLPCPLDECSGDCFLVPTLGCARTLCYSRDDCPRLVRLVVRAKDDSRAHSGSYQYASPPCMVSLGRPRRPKIRLAVSLETRQYPCGSARTTLSNTLPDTRS